MFASCLGKRRRLSQQNPFKTRVSLVELGQISRHFVLHFETKPTKKLPRCGRCVAVSICNAAAKAVAIFGVCMSKLLYQKSNLE